MEQHFELTGVLKSQLLQMRPNIQWIRIIFADKKISVTSAAMVPQIVGFSCLEDGQTDDVIVAIGVSSK